MPKCDCRTKLWYTLHVSFCIESAGVPRNEGLNFVIVGGVVCGNPTQRVLPHSLIYMSRKYTWFGCHVCGGMTHG